MRQDSATRSDLPPGGGAPHIMQLMIVFLPQAVRKPGDRGIEHERHGNDSFPIKVR
jgi:hypothetical protein